MNKLTTLAACIASCLSVNAAAVTGNAPIFFNASEVNTANLSDEKQRYIIHYNDDLAGSVDVSEWNQIIESLFYQYWVEPLWHMDFLNASVAELSPDQLMTLLNDPAIHSVEEDPKRYLLESWPSDYQPQAEQVPYGITMVQAPQVSDGVTGNTKVCVIDTGYQLSHPDLPSGNATGFSFQGHGPWSTDGNGHGTHVAGTMVALRNNIGVVGVIGSGQSGIHNVKIFNDSGQWTYASNLIQAIQSCKDADAKVVNMSLGGSQGSVAEQNAMQQFYSDGVLLVAAAGNSGNTSLSYPASYDAVVSVAAINSNRQAASFSQRNAQVELAAPGVRVNSTYPNSTYRLLDGTSMASPHVAGVAALVWSHYESCSAAEIRQALNNSALDLGAQGRDPTYGFGLVQAKAAYDLLSTSSCAGNDDDDDDTSPDNELFNGEALTNLSGAQGQELLYFINIPQNATNLRIQTSGGSGDVDLYVRNAIEPTLSQFDCRPYRTGNNELCQFNAPNSGTYFIKLVGYSAFSGVQLIATYDEPADSDDGFEEVISNLSVAQDAWQHFTVQVPAGMSQFRAQISGGTGDADLYVRQGAQPTLSQFDCRPYRNGNNESCVFSNPQSGTWHVSIRGYRAASGVTLQMIATP